MSDDIKVSLTRIGMVLGVLAAVAALFGTFVILPYRMDAAEKSIKAIQDKTEVDHDLLQRIDERTARIEKALDRIAK
jgi:uncharacterized membrane protein